VAGMVVWGFTAMLLDSVLAAAGLDRPWDTTDVRPLATPSGGPQPRRFPGPGPAAPTEDDDAAPGAAARTVPGP
jgi:hypothetical protein